MDKRIIAAVIIIVIVVIFCALPQTSPFPQIRDSDGDGTPDADDVFPYDSSETLDSDGDGYGNNGDAFPNDPSEWRDRDGDEVGDNADIYDEGEGGVKITITKFDMITDVDDCDPFFSVIWYPGDPETPDFKWESPIYNNQKHLTDPVGAFVVIDIFDGASSISLRIDAYDDIETDGFSSIDIAATPPYFITVEAPFSESYFVEGGTASTPDAQLMWKIEVVEYVE
jgi:hypothetical protein